MTRFTSRAMKRSLHDLSVLFDDDKAFVIWVYRGIKLAQLNETLDDIVPGTEREIIPEGAGMGEGLHFYKIDGRYFITSAWYAGRMRMPAAPCTSGSTITAQVRPPSSASAASSAPPSGGAR